MKNEICNFFILAVGIVLAGIAIAFGIAIGRAIEAFARNPSLVEEIMEMLRSGLLITLVPYFLLLITFFLCKGLTCTCRQLVCKKYGSRYLD